MAVSPTVERLITTLRRKVYAPVYFLQGAEPYPIDTLVRVMEEEILTPAERGFNLRILYGKEHSLQEIILQAKCFPLMGQWQVVIVKDAQALQDLQKASGEKMLMDYLQAPNLQTLLVFVYKYKTLDSRKALTKAIQKQGVLLTSKKYYAHEIPAWIQTYLKKLGYDIAPEAALLLQMLVGDSLQILAGELQKILLNLPQGAQISSELVRLHVGMSRGFDVFALQKALVTKDADRACEITAYFAKNTLKNPLLPVIGFLTHFFAQLLYLHHAGPTPPATTPAQLHIPAFLRKDYVKATHHYTLAQVIQNIHYLHQADLQAKGIDYPAIPEGEIVKELIAKLVQA